MGGNKQNKKRKHSDNAVKGERKSGRYTQTPEDVSSVSNILKETNSVLYNDEINVTLDLNTLFDECLSTNTTHVSNQSEHLPETSNMADNSPSNADIMKCLEKINTRLGNVESKLACLHSLEKKIENFDKDLVKLWNCIKDQNDKTNSRLNVVEEKVESTDFNVGIVSSKISDLEDRNKKLCDDLVYIQSQSMRNNLIFSNIEEAPTGSSEDCEQVIRNFLCDKMKIANDLVKEMKFERVHRIGDHSRRDRPRSIVVKFNLFKERELVRKSGVALKGTKFYVNEQFPKEVTSKRKELLPKMKEARQSGHKAWLSYDTLYIDGKAQK